MPGERQVTHQQVRAVVGRERRNSWKGRWEGQAERGRKSWRGRKKAWQGGERRGSQTGMLAKVIRYALFSRLSPACRPCHTVNSCPWWHVDLFGIIEMLDRYGKGWKEVVIPASSSGDDGRGGEAVWVVAWVGVAARPLLSPIIFPLRYIEKHYLVTMYLSPLRMQEYNALK